MAGACERSVADSLRHLKAAAERESVSTPRSPD
jgi:hypothetical protein